MVPQTETLKQSPVYRIKTVKEQRHCYTEHMTAQRSDQKTAQQKSSSAPSDIETLVQWQFTEEKAKTTKDKDLLIGIVGATATVLSIMTKNYPFALLLALATLTIIHIRRKQPKKLLFKITPIGLFMDNDFIELQHIKTFNIIDDPGKTARLILKVERIIHMNEIIPIYDVDINDIEKALTSINVQKEEELAPTLMDNLTTILL